MNNRERAEKRRSDVAFKKSRLKVWGMVITERTIRRETRKMRIEANRDFYGWQDQDQ